MRRALAILVFATAAGAATAVGTGVVVAPHVDPPGTAPFHTHVLAAYRLPLFLDTLRARLDPHQGLMRTELVFDAAGLVLGLLVVLWPRLPRPSLLAIADVAPPRLAGTQWRRPRTTGPPRVPLHAS